MKILIVEDEGLVADHLIDILLSSGYQVVGVADSSDGALAMVAELKPELILMDIRIKGELDGIATTSKLREQFDIPVVYLTGHSDARTLDRAKTTGAFGYLTKPIYQTNLTVTLEMAIHKHRSDRAVRNHRSWMATVLNTMADAMAVVDADRRIQFLNGPAEALIGWTYEQCRDVDIATVMHLRDGMTDADADEILTPPISPRPPSELPHGLIAEKRSGETFPIEGAVSPSVDEGRVVGAVITFRDATQRQVREHELRHQEKMNAIGRFAAGIKYDFNNLLALILAHTDDLLATESKDTTHHALAEVKKAGMSAASLTQQLLTFSSVDRADQQEADLNAIIWENEELFRSVGGPSIKWRWRLDPELGSVRADAGQIKQVLVNLIANATDAVSGSGRIMVETANIDVPGSDAAPGEPERFVALTVTDNGSGMSSETAEHLFEPFFTTKQPGGGTGLSLSIVHSIVKDHGGTIYVESGPGEGASFTMYFPRIVSSFPEARPRDSRETH